MPSRRHAEVPRGPPILIRRAEHRQAQRRCRLRAVRRLRYLSHTCKSRSRHEKQSVPMFFVKKDQTKKHLQKGLELRGPTLRL